MLYLTDKYDKEEKASYSRDKNPQKYYEMVQWLFFQNAGVGPMQGQANRIPRPPLNSVTYGVDFFRYAPEKIKYGIDRYQNETRRLYRVLDTRLRENGDYLVGDHITIGISSITP
jgi:glutathione S-transferase